MLIQESARLLAFSKRAAAGLDYAYFPAPSGHIYASACLSGKLTARFYVSIVISPSRQPFELNISGKSVLCEAAAIKPLIRSGKKIVDGPLLTVHLEPSHPHFRAFRVIPEPGIMPIDRTLFAPLDGDLNAACAGGLALEKSAQVIERIVSTVTELLPKPTPQDVRVVKVCELLRSRPNISLPDIAAALNLSYNRTSHLFTDTMGLPFRSYQLWLKVRRANRLLWSGESLTAAAHRAGFADSAHFCRTYQQIFGRPPSYFFDRRFVKIYAVERRPDILNHTQRFT